MEKIPRAALGEHPDAVDLSPLNPGLGRAAPFSPIAEPAFPLPIGRRLPAFLDDRIGCVRDRFRGFLIDSPLWEALRFRLQEFDPLLVDPHDDDYEKSDASDQEAWDALVDRLQAQVDRLATDPEGASAYFQNIAKLISALRNLIVQGHLRWIDSFFGQLVDRFSGNSLLTPMLPDIERLRLSCTNSGLTAAQLRERLTVIGSRANAGIADYCTIAETIREQERALAVLSSSIRAASLQQRQRIRDQETVRKQEIERLRCRLLDIETSLSHTFAPFPEDAADSLAPRRGGADKDLTNTSSHQAASPKGTGLARPDPERLSPTNVGERRSPLGGQSADSADRDLKTTGREPLPGGPTDKVRHDPPGTLRAGAARRSMTPTPSRASSRSALDPLDAPKSGDLGHSGRTASSAADLSPRTERPEVHTGGLGGLAGRPASRKAGLETVEPTAVPGRGWDDLLAAPLSLNSEERMAFGRAQRGWLERRQPLRAWLLAHEIETRLTDHGDGIRDFALVPSWACELLIRLSDPQMPWSEEETESLLKVATLPSPDSELMVLWITASLMEGLSDKPLMAVRAFSPRYFQLPPGCLAHDCAEHILMPIHRSGRSSEMPSKQTEEVLRQLRTLIAPVNDKAQGEKVLRFWGNLVKPEGILGQLLTSAERRQFPSHFASLVDHVKSLAEWPALDPGSRRDILSRVAEFSRLMEMARTALIPRGDGPPAEPLAISRQAVIAIIDRINREGGSGWWLEAIKSGLVTL